VNGRFWRKAAARQTSISVKKLMKFRCRGAHTPRLRPAEGIVVPVTNLQIKSLFLDENSRHNARKASEGSDPSELLKR
jgi:hypothetical protein